MDRKSRDRSRNWYAWSNASSRRPVACPALTIWIVNRLNWDAGAFRIASAREEPARTSKRLASATPPIARARNRSRSISRLRSRGIPARKSVVSPWRKGSRSRRAPRPGRPFADGPAALSGRAEAGHTRMGRYPLSRSRSRADLSSGASTTPSDTRPSRSVTLYPNTAIGVAPTRERALHRLLPGHADHFLDRRDSPADFFPAVLPEEPHPVRHGARPDRPGVGPRKDQLADLPGDGKQLEDPGPSAEPRPAPRLAPASRPYVPLGDESGLPL